MEAQLQQQLLQLSEAHGKQLEDSLAVLDKKFVSQIEVGQRSKLLFWSKITEPARVQLRFHECAIKCVKTASDGQARRSCTEQCSTPLQQAQTHVQQAVNTYQNRMASAASDCQERLRVDLQSLAAKGDVTEADKGAAAQDFMKCFKPAAQDGVKMWQEKLLPTLEAQLKQFSQQ